jgi:hypothetical protein
MATDNRDQQFERALARHFSNASPDSACPDAEILAAYHDRTLSMEEMARWKTHIAACARCQESLAFIEQTESLPAEDWEHQREDDLVPAEEMALPQGEFPSLAARQRSHAPLAASPVAAVPPQISDQVKEPAQRAPWRWIVPVGALAAAIIVFIGVKEVRTQREEQKASLQVAENRAPTPVAPLPQPAPPADIATTPPSGAAAGSVGGVVAREKAEVPASRKSLPKSAAEAPVLIAPPKITADDSIVTEDEKKTPPAGIAGRIAAARPSSSLGHFQAGAGAGTGAATSPQPPAPAQASAAPGASPNPPALAKETESQLTVQNQDLQTNAENIIVTSTQRQTATGYNLVQLAKQNPRFIIAPVVRYAWRLGDAGSIQRSTDAGKTWKPQQSGVSADLTAGSAPSDKICWIVGKAGTIILTTDGGDHWNAIVSPITNDLGGVHATDATHASIWDVPNRQSYQTSDGGVTWTRTANE